MMKRLNCNACQGELSPPLFKVRDLPLVDSFCSTPISASQVPRFSIDICQCNTCQTIQIASPPDTAEIYRNYIYESRSSPDLLDHFTQYARVVSRTVPGKDRPVLEIGANDGLFLHQLIKEGFNNLVAVDPSPQTAMVSFAETEANVEVINQFFCYDSIKHFEKNSFVAIFANNCFSHISDLLGVLNLCAKFLSSDGTLFVEVQSTLDLVESVVFDYIYHEHYFYHSMISFENLAKMAGLEVYGVEHVSTKGGSYRFSLGHKGAHVVESSVSYWKYRESIAGVHSTDTWLKLESYLAKSKLVLHEWFSNSDKPVIGFGASATGTVFIRYMAIEHKLGAIVDDNPKRQGLYAPGTAIPIISIDELRGDERCLILAWRHSSLIVPKLRARGIVSISPLPYLTFNG